jgi:hypothetical protein
MVEFNLNLCGRTVLLGIEPRDLREMFFTIMELDEIHRAEKARQSFAQLEMEVFGTDIKGGKS